MSLAAPTVAAPAVTIRPFAPGDAAAISALFQRHAPYRRDAAFWQWLNRLLPARPSHVAVAEVDGELVAHYAILPFELRLADGRTVMAGLGAQAFVAPEHRRQVSIFQVSACAYGLAARAGLAFVYGFPNANYRLVQEKIERWRCINLFKAWTKPAGPVAAGGLELCPARLADEAELNAALALWDEASSSTGANRPADVARWWQVRYTLHPHQPYRLHWLVRGMARVGLVAAKVHRAEDEVRAHLVDYVVAAGVPTGELLAAFEAAYGAEATRFVHWPISAPFAAALVEAGYQPDGFETYFGARALGPEPLPAGVLDAAAWRLPMGLSDAF